MKVYLVGGALRDKLLGLPLSDRDWVVTGASPEDMRAQGFRQVGKDFPVFLHPETGEEYALARTERKVAPGYKGFQVHATPDVRLEDDLRRRDLTINAMAEDSNGHLIDPFGGREDLAQGLLRHVSPAFSEDPVRILRVARFAARFAALGFRVAPQTCTLMQVMVDAGEVDALVPERVWVELERALAEQQPSVFFQVLRQCRALAPLFPEIDCLYGIPQRPEYHPEIDTGIHTMMVLEQASLLSPDSQVRFAALVHDVGKGATPPEEWPRHVRHEQRGVRIIEALCRRLRIPNQFRDLARLVARYHCLCHRAEELRPGTLLKMLEALDVFRRPQRLTQFLLACEADARGRQGYEQQPYLQAERLRTAVQSALTVDPSLLAIQGYRGKEMAAALRRHRIAAIAAGNTPRQSSPP